jgi:rhodanese-related sulfurtransferase
VPAPAPPPAPAAAARQFLPHPDKEYVEIGYDDVANLYGQKALFLDARRTSVYEQGHISGARTFSVWESDVDEKVNKLYEERNDPRQQLEPIVIYCSGGDCEDSHMLARKLWGLQFNNIWVYKDGFPDWEKRGGRISRGSNP